MNLKNQQKNEQYINQKPISIDKVEIKGVVLSKKDSFKYFNRCKNEANTFLVLLCIKLPQMNAYAKCMN